MNKGELSAQILEENPDLAKIKSENDRLKYRIDILKRSIDEEKERKTTKEAKKSSDVKQVHKFVIVENYGDSIVSRLTSILKSSIEIAFPTVENVPFIIMETSRIQFGDYQCNSAMAIAQKLAKSGQKTNPREVAEKIVQNCAPSELIEKLEIAGAGFVNIFLNRLHLCSTISRMCCQGIDLPKVAVRKAVVDFSSPNIAKEMHVGHLRSTVIGDGICRLLEHVQFQVVRVNHVGDWGTQFGMLIAHLQDKFPHFLHQTPPIADLQAFYKESKHRFDVDEQFKARAYQCVVKLQRLDPDFIKAWQMICQVSRNEFQKIYDRLDVRLTEKGESFYQTRMQDVVREIDEKGFLCEEQGRKLMFPLDCHVPLTIVKSDGGHTYGTSDLATLKYRLQEENADWCIYVVDSGQHLHLQTIYAAGRDLQWYDQVEKRVEHVGFGLVLGEDQKKLKSRSGDTIKLSELLDEGMKRSLAKLQEKERDKVLTEEELVAAQEAVAYGCIKYADLSHNRTQDYVFSFDRILDDRGNTFVYLLYAYTRIRSIARNAEVTREQLNQFLNKEMLILNHPSELKLAKMIVKYSDCILSTLESLLLHQLCDFVYQLATVFHDFYSDCYVIEKDKETGIVKHIHYNRLVLCEVSADIMEDCFGILGLRTIEKM